MTMTESRIDSETRLILRAIAQLLFGQAFVDMTHLLDRGRIGS
jgi:hypothetical protein